MRSCDERFYIKCPGRTIHVIEHPDSAGLACRVVQHKYVLQWPIIGGLPHFPNFRLGALPPGLCGQTSGLQPPPLRDPPGLKLHPNPAVSRLYVETSAAQGRYRVLDLLGRTVLTGRFEAPAFELDLSAQSPGAYVLSLTPENGGALVEKFVLMR